MQCRDSNPRPSERESPPITTRPGLPPNEKMFSHWYASGFLQFKIPQVLVIEPVYRIQVPTTLMVHGFAISRYFNAYDVHGLGRADRWSRQQLLRGQVRGLPSARRREWPLANHHFPLHLDRRRPHRLPPSLLRLSGRLHGPLVQHEPHCRLAKRPLDHRAENEIRHSLVSTRQLHLCKLFWGICQHLPTCSTRSQCHKQILE